jgi:hypothetical protein
MNKIIKHYYQAFVLSLLAVFVIALGGIANGVHAHPLVVNQAVPSATIAAAVAAITYQGSTQDATLLGYANELRYTDSATPPNDSDISTSDKITGLFDPNTDTIYVVRNQSALEGGPEVQDEIGTVAYEYMHYVWSNDLDGSAQASERQALESYDQENSYFNSLVSQYTGDQNTLDNEYAATACTEIQPIQLSSSFNEWCDQYIPNREVVLF